MTTYKFIVTILVTMLNLCQSYGTSRHLLTGFTRRCLGSRTIWHVCGPLLRPPELILGVSITGKNLKANRQVVTVLLYSPNATSLPSVIIRSRPAWRMATTKCMLNLSETLFNRWALENCGEKLCAVIDQVIGESAVSAVFR